ncbi:unnamed protein product [Protopolystoma xenopodis]|uniref:Uncharacterized protein n=1 Tax=Protopolystoma xenopodis TaxID=117903 RepID=A0A3S5B784_9PLAT|nr:unnamed protein product [Protopolystoma xenopodis]
MTALTGDADSDASKTFEKVPSPLSDAGNHDNYYGRRLWTRYSFFLPFQPQLIQHLEHAKSVIMDKIKLEIQRLAWYSVSVFNEANRSDIVWLWRVLLGTFQNICPSAAAAAAADIAATTPYSRQLAPGGRVEESLSSIGASLPNPPGVRMTTSHSVATALASVAAIHLPSSMAAGLSNLASAVGGGNLTMDTTYSPNVYGARGGFSHQVNSICLGLGASGSSRRPIGSGSLYSSSATGGLLAAVNSLTGGPSGSSLAGNGASLISGTTSLCAANRLIGASGARETALGEFVPEHYLPVCMAAYVTVRDVFSLFLPLEGVPGAEDDIHQ